MNDSDYEEEILVFADFKNQLPHESANSKIAVKIIGLEKDPMAEINGHIFKGTYDFAMGTNVFFEKDHTPKPSDPLFEDTCRQNYKYFNKTMKVINFQRIFVEQHNSANTDATSMDIDDNENRDNENLKIDITYEDAIKQFPKKS